MQVTLNLKTGECVDSNGDPFPSPSLDILQQLREKAVASGESEDATVDIVLRGGVPASVLCPKGDCENCDAERKARESTLEQVLSRFKATLYKLTGKELPSGFTGDTEETLDVKTEEDDSEVGEVPQREISRMASDNKPVKITDDRGNVLADRLPDIAKLKVDIERVGDKLVIPVGMPLETAVAVILRQMDSEERIVTSTTAIDSYPLDLAYALTRAVERRYNFVATKNSVGMFGMPIPPPLVGLEVDVNKTEQVYWGRIPLPGFTDKEHVQATVAIKNGIWVGAINAVVKGKNKPAVDELIALTREELNARSVYKGRAIKVVFTKADPEQGFNPDDQPRFMNLSDVNGPTDLIFNEKVEEQLQTNIFGFVQKTDLFVKHGVPLKRGVLLEGPYGTGKTLTARVLAKLCEENRWTFLYLKSVTMLPQAIEFAKIFGRTVIFAEDVDQVFDGESRDEDVNIVLNTMDGIDTKNSEIMVVLTTNSVEDIHQAMLRPGRLDAIINIAVPDAKVAERLIRKIGGSLIKPTENITAAAELLAGRNAAAIKEVVVRAKAAEISRLKDANDKLQISGDSLRITAETMQYHLDLLKEAPEDTRTPMQVLGEAVGAELGRVIKGAPGILTEASNLQELVETTVRKTNEETRKNSNHKGRAAVAGE